MRPKLIHPRAVTLHRRKETETDPDLGPSGKIEWEAPATLPGQVKYKRYDFLSPGGGGDDPDADGHVVFIARDWYASGGAKGDELELSPSSSRLVVTEVRPAAQYGGEAQHVHVIFARRRAE